MSFVAERDSQNGLAHRSRTSSFWSDYANDTAKPQNATNGLRPEIPDSQPNTFEYRGNSSKTPDNPASFKTVATDIIPGGTKLTPRGEARWPLHCQGFNCNGRLPCEAPQYREAMDEEATQQATQPFFDPRRRGITNSGREQDDSDIICVLYPTSPAATEAVKLTAEAASQHIKNNHTMSRIDEEGDTIVSDDSDSHEDRSADSDAENTQPHDPARNGHRSSSPVRARDIALRFSSKVHNLCLGFVFGRNPKVSDLLLSGTDNMQVSNKHFRIFINNHGVLMLEDTSTNGTIVDDVLLQGSKSKTRARHAQPRRTLSHGSIIELPTITRTNGDSVRFNIYMPSRDSNQTRYNQNLATYLALIEQTERQAINTAALATTGLQISLPAVPVSALNQGVQQGTTPNGSILAAATGQHHHGMHWNGGDKYNVIGYIGQGAFAMVYKLSSKQDGEVYAVKEIDKGKFAKGGSSAEKARKELDVIRNLQHPNIVKYIDHLDAPTHLFIVMEFVPFGDLTSYTSAGSLMPEYVCVHLARQIMEALDYLHRRHIVHRDIKPDNILMASDYPYAFKLSDFGLSKMITNKAEYLKTFCGTLLYCAPEIYPGYERVRLGLPLPTKRTRASDVPPAKTQRYENSVDTWSFAAVLYHLLCGRAPWAGASEAMMLTTVMNNPVDWDRLRQAGISSDGIDFVERMLVIEPSLRASDKDVLSHPWLQSANGKPIVVEDQAVELDASQLSLADDDGENEEVDEDDGLDYYDDMEDPRRSKRARGWSQGNLARNGWGVVMGQPQTPMAGPVPTIPLPSPPQRLFGEIGSSALRSSGVLGQTAYGALGVDGAGSYDPDESAIAGGGSYDPTLFIAPGGGTFDPATLEMLARGSYNLSSATASYNDPGFGQTSNAEDVSYIDPLHVSSHPANFDVTSENIQYPRLPAGASYSNGAPSLLGAEALVGQLNMASPESAVSDTSGHSRLASPKTPHSRRFSPSVSGSKLASQDTRGPEEDDVSKRSKTDLSSTSPSARPQSIGGPNQSPSKIVQAEQGANEDASISCKASVHDNESDKEQDGQQPRGPTKSIGTMPPTAFNSQESAQDSNGGDKAPSRPASRGPAESSNAENKAPSQPQSNTPGPPIITFTRPSSSGNAPTVTIANPADFLKPSIVFGNLVLVKGSVPSVHKIKIAARTTTFGRDLESHFIHQNSSDTRVPKNAIDIQMWYPTIDKDINACKDWSTNKDLKALISTRTSRYIKINGIRLMRGEGCWQYGELRSGDIVTVFELPEGMTAKKPKDSEFLRFRCEFYIGASRQSRKEGHPFKVLKEKTKFQQHEERRSRESTEAETVDLIPENSKGSGEASKGNNTGEGGKGSGEGSSAAVENTT